MQEEPAALEIRDLRIGYGNRIVVPGLSVSLRQGAITALVGPNGSGKSTVLRTMARLLKPVSGAIYLDGRAINQLPTKELARQLAILPQSAEVPSGVTVRELAGYGRYPHQRLLRGSSDEDEAAITWALEATNLALLGERPVDSLSGGERQRAWVSMALAQQTPILLLDEPTTFLDVHYQLDVLELVRRLNREHHITVGWVLHDLNQAAAYSDEMILLHDGQTFASGSPEAVLTAQNVQHVFGVETIVIPHPTTGSPICLPYRLVSSPLPV